MTENARWTTWNSTSAAERRTHAVPKHLLGLTPPSLLERMARTEASKEYRAAAKRRNAILDKYEVDVDPPAHRQIEEPAPVVVAPSSLRETRRDLLIAGRREQARNLTWERNDARTNVEYYKSLPDTVFDGMVEKIAELEAKLLQFSKENRELRKHPETLEVRIAALNADMTTARHEIIRLTADNRDLRDDATRRGSLYVRYTEEWKATIRIYQVALKRHGIDVNELFQPAEPATAHANGPHAAGREENERS